MGLENPRIRGSNDSRIFRDEEKSRKRRCRFRDGLDGSARVSLALFDRAQQRRVNTAKQTPCPREVRTRPDSTRDARRGVARRALVTQGSGVAGVRRASDACGRWRGPSPATAEGRPTAAPESWRARRMLGIDATHVSRHPRRHGLARARRRARGRARAMRANAGFSETRVSIGRRKPPPRATPGGGGVPSTPGGSRAPPRSARRSAASLAASLASVSAPASPVAAF